MNRIQKQQARAQAPTKLLQRGIADFQVKNNGAHIMIKHQSGVVHYWPGTDKWRREGRRTAKGFNQLVEFLTNGFAKQKPHKPASTRLNEAKAALESVMELVLESDIDCETLGEIQDIYQDLDI